MSLLLTLALVHAVAQLLPQAFAEMVATLMGLRLVTSNYRARRLLLASAIDPTTTVSTWDRRPGKAERRALQQALNAALDSTMFRRLLPIVATRNCKILTFMENVVLRRARG